jgi:hypothetical protein
VQYLIFWEEKKEKSLKASFFFFSDEAENLIVSKADLTL